jgi:glucose/arabinose dehydrogenase
MTKSLKIALLSIILVNVSTSNFAKNGDSENAVKNNSNHKEFGKYEIYEGHLKSLSAVNIRNAKLELITNQLNKPWAFEFINKHKVIITEIGGQIKVLNFNDKSLITLQNLPQILTNDYQIGLLDIEIHPDFDQNKKIFISYAKHDPESKSYFSLTVAAATINENRLENITTIFDDNPFSWSPSNFGGALEFDDKGFLYIATGDRSDSESAQSKNLLQGKVLRVNDDGTAAPGNPFEDDETYDNRIYSIGVRNPQGLHFDSNSQIMFEAEHGPMGGDEINIIIPGKNYGWPVATYGLSYTTQKIGKGTHHDGMTQPLFYYLPSEAISPLTVYRGTMFQEWDGDILVGALKGKHVSKLDYENGAIKSEYPILTEINDRIRDIKVAHDGSIYILTQNGQLNRLFREANQHKPVKDKTDGQTIYKMACSGCHDKGAYGSPVLGNSSQWKKVSEQPIALTYKHTIEGINSMPARGYCNICSDEHLKKAVNYMLEQAKNGQQ